MLRGEEGRVTVTVAVPMAAGGETAAGETAAGRRAAGSVVEMMVSVDGMVGHDDLENEAGATREAVVV